MVSAVYPRVCRNNRNLGTTSKEKNNLSMKRRTRKVLEPSKVKVKNCTYIGISGTRRWVPFVHRRIGLGNGSSIDEQR